MRNFSKNTIKKFKKMVKDGQPLSVKIQSNGGLISESYKFSERLEKISDLGVSININSYGGSIGKI